MSRNLALVLLASFVLLAGCGKDGTSPGLGNMTVVVIRDELPVSSAVVSASPRGAKEAEGSLLGSTGDDGRCEFQGIPEGTYDVNASVSVEGVHFHGENLGVDVNRDATASLVIALLDQDNDLLPMALGNWWAFDTGDTMEIGPVKVVDGVTTYGIGPKGHDVHPPYLTHGRNAIYMHGYETITGDDHIIRPPTVWIDLTAKAGESWVIRDWGQGQLESEWETVDTPIGQYAGCWKVRFWNQEQDFTFWLKAGVGFVKSASSGETSLLVGYGLR